ncbi:MAG: DUF5606 domain-containing protein [Flavisolibacter sp.]|nr:DUF5606 domain-containing protein [Flavisolibacter sp.]
MEYKKIVAVTGLPGLYEIMGSKSDGAIVRSLDDGSTKFVSSRVHNLSHLESIEVYTTRENVNLAEVFEAMQNSNEPLPDVKNNKALKAYFENVYPDLDFDRVYASDMKKMVRWFEVLRNSGVEIKRNDVPEEAGTEESNESKESSSTNVAETLAAAGEKITLNVTPGDTPESARAEMKGEGEGS